MSRIGLFLTFGALLPWSPLSGQGGVLVSADWLEANLSRSGLVILHASYDGSDYEQEHLPGARLVLMDRIAWEGETGVGTELRNPADIRGALEEVGVSDGSTLVVYGSNPMVAARLWMTLDVMGAAAGTPLFLDGGLQLWVEEGRPVTVDRPSVSRGKVTLLPDPNRLATAEWILARLGHDDLAVVDARPNEEYTGADGGLGGQVHPGHIPGAYQLFWEDLIESREHPRFLPLEELAARFSAAGADPGDTVVTYCQAGFRASVDYMIARMLGYETRIFDGSWRDWGSRDYPYYLRAGNGKTKTPGGAPGP
jgi:thiosulfate/3-mercaptopyruvate sulfurtransferase